MLGSSSQQSRRDHQRTPLPPSMLDQMEAMVRHLEFRRRVPLWRGIYSSKNSVGLTWEEEQELNAVPRTRIQVAAMMEAENQWLTRSIRQIRVCGEAVWAFEAAKSLFSDQTNIIPSNDGIPGDLPMDEILSVVRERVHQQRQELGIVAIQRPRPHEVNKWLVYDLREKGLKWWSITHWLFGLAGKTTYESDAQAHYAKVHRAYRAACAMIRDLDHAEPSRPTPSLFFDV